MKKIIIYTAFFLLIIGCYSYRSKKHFGGTVVICNKLYVEFFNVFSSGAFGGDMISEYLTDSTNFRIYIGTFDNADYKYVYGCYGDSIMVKKLHNTNRDTFPSVIETRIFSLKKLEKEKQFE